jgi:hypothetical protein
MKSDMSSAIYLTGQPLRARNMKIIYHESPWEYADPPESEPGQKKYNIDREFEQAEMSASD